MADEGQKNALGGGSSLFKAIVLDVILDPKINTPGGMASVWGIPTTPRLENAPPNSCIVRLYGAAADEEPLVAYPFFPDHLSIPVKSGEAVWIASPPLSKPSGDDAYWICKISSAVTTADVNFTHAFRNASKMPDDPSDNKATVSTADRASQPPLENTELSTLPSFLNTAGGADILGPVGKTKSKRVDGTKPNPFDKIYSASSANTFTIEEPVPGFVKRPGDLVLQASNNALMWLGQDRGFSSGLLSTPENELSASSAEVPPKSFSGTIDLVTGRSRYITADGTTRTTKCPDPKRTGIKTILNSRSYFELNKEDELPNPLAGDLDFDVDASRIYVSMKTDGDKNFNLINELNRLPAAIVTGSVQPVSESAYIIAKSDEVRIIARKQLEDEYFPDVGNPEINGSIKIIKEGTKDDDLAAVMLLPDGTVQISGSRIFLGRHFDDGGKDESTAGPDDAVHVQPYVRYQQLEDLLNAILDNIDAFCDTLNTHVTPGYGNPSPQILEAAATLKGEVATRKSEIETLKSERIFGE